MPASAVIPCVLSIAGSDSGGCSGIQADLKTFAALGVHGLSAIAAITAQNLRSVESSQILPARLLLAQLDALIADFPIAAVKIGMLGNAANIRAVAHWLRAQRLRNIVLDPVLISSSGSRLLTLHGIDELRSALLPLADIVTPNVPEAEALLGCRIRSVREMRQAAHALLQHGARAVLLKGGHFNHATPSTRVRDYFIDANSETRFEHARRAFAARGTGCTLASALAVGLALDRTPLLSARCAERYVQSCLRRSTRPGKGAQRMLGHIAIR
ncbi:MAG: bifunctional hydroxymethylpyrimidine kinase/phosphomethylpyrimidine kinase [Rudaea sp.]